MPNKEPQAQSVLADMLTILVCLCSVKSMKAAASRNMAETPKIKN